MAIDLSLLCKVEFPRPSRIDRAIHPTGGSHQNGLWFQAAVGSLSVRHISRGVVLLENGGVVMLQDDVPLRVRNIICISENTKFDRRSSSIYFCCRELALCHVGRYMEPWEVPCRRCFRDWSFGVGEWCQPELAPQKYVCFPRYICTAGTEMFPPSPPAEAPATVSALEQSGEGTTTLVKSRKGQRRLGRRRVKRAW